MPEKLSSQKHSVKHFKIRSLFIALLIVTGWGNSINAFGQKSGQALIDSLVDAIPRLKDDTNKVDLLNNLARLNDAVNPEQGIHYGKQALELANMLRWKRGEGDAYRMMSIIYWHRGDFEQSITTQENALEIYRSINYTKGIASAYHNLGSVYKAKGDFSKALINLNDALKFWQLLSDKKGSADAMNGIANIQNAQGNYKSALLTHAKCLEVRQQIKDEGGVSDSYNNIGLVYYNMSDFPNALQNYLASLRIKEKRNDYRGMANTYLNIGNVYYSKKSFSDASKNYNEALKLYEKMGNKKGSSSAYANLGAVCTDLKKYKEGIFFYLKALDIEKSIGDNEEIPNTYTNIGMAYYQAKDYENALKFLWAAVQPERENKMANEIANSYANIGGVYVAKKEFTLAKKYLDSALTLAQKIGNKETILLCYRNMSLMDSTKGNYNSAYDSYRAYVHLNDSIFNSENTSKIVHLQDQYEFEKKEASIRATNDKRSALADANHKSHIRLGALLAGAMLLISFISFYSYVRIRNTKHQVQLTTLQQEALNAQMSDHFIGNSMRTINKFIRANDQERAGEYLTLFSGLVRKVLENSFQRLVPLHDDLELVKDYVALEAARFPPGNFDFSITLDPEIDADHALVPPMIFQVLAENAIHHGLQTSSVRRLSLAVHKAGDMLECRVEDSGIGRAAALQAIIEGGGRKSFGSSIAEKLIKTVNQHGKHTYFKIADLMGENNQATGTLVAFSLPYNLDN